MATPIKVKFYKGIEQSGKAYYELLPEFNTPSGMTPVSDVNEINQATQYYQNLINERGGAEGQGMSKRLADFNTGGISSEFAYNDKGILAEQGQIASQKAEQEKLASGQYDNWGTVEAPLLVPKGTPKPSTVNQPTGYQGNNVPLNNGGATNQQPAQTTPQSTQQTYQVPAGSNLTRSAQAMGITLQQLLDANPEYKANPNMVQAGAMLKYPTGRNTGSGAGSGATGANNAPGSDLQAQLKDKEAQIKALKDNNLTDIAQLTKDASGNYVPITQPQASPTPPSDFITQYTQIMKDLGLSNIKTSYEKAVQDYADLQNELNDKIADISKNPWLSESGRVSQINKMNERYQDKLSILTNQQQLFKSLYDEGVATAKYLTTGEITQQQDLAKIAEQKAEALSKLNSTIENLVGPDGQMHSYLISYDSAGLIKSKQDLGIVSKTSAPSTPTIKSGNLVISEGDVSKNQQVLNTSRGTDSYANSKIYLDMHDEWVNVHNGLEADFFKYFPPSDYLNPNDTSIPQYIRNKIEAIDTNLFHRH